MIPDVHLAGQSPHLDDRLAEEVITLPSQLLPQPRLEVVVLVPHPDLDPVARVVTLAVKRIISIFCTSLDTMTTTYKENFSFHSGLSS